MNIQLNSFGNEPIIDWEEANDQYGDDFMEMLTLYCREQLKEILSKAMDGAEKNDWALFFSEIHRLKGSGCYVSLKQITLLADEAQKFLLDFIVKVNPKGKTPAEQYKVQPTFQALEQEKSLQHFVLILNASERLYELLQDRKVDIPYKGQLDQLKTKVSILTNKLSNQVLYRRRTSQVSQQSAIMHQSQTSKKPPDSGSTNNKIISNFENTSQKKQENEPMKKSSETQKQEQQTPAEEVGHIDPPASDLKCCSQCLIF